MKKRLFSVLLAVCMILSAAPAAFAAGTAFADVQADDWFAREAAYVFEKDLMKGVGGNAFQPNGQVSRAMVWTTLARLDGVNTEGSTPWYRAGQDWAVVTGVSDGTDPNGRNTREQLVTMMYRYAQLKGYDVSVGENTNILSYEDAFGVSEWAVAAMQWACGAGLINGNGAKLEPRGAANRAQLAVILYRYAEQVIPAQTQPEEETTPETYTVTFEYHYGGKGVFATVTVEAGQTVGSVGRPFRAGYTFAGWYTAGGERVTSRTVITSDLTVQAKWKKIVEEEKEEDIPVHTHQYTAYSTNLDGTHIAACSCGDATTENCRYPEGGSVCCDCGYDRGAVAVIGDTYYATLEAAVEAGGSILMLKDVDLPTAAVINNEVTLDLNGKTLTVSQDTVGDGVFHVIAGGKLTINGEGTVNGLGNNDYSMAVWADGGQVVINGGTFTNVGAGEDDHYDLIYAKNGGSVEICGGTFTCQTPKWTLNKHDSTGSIITVKGGTFLGYDPSHSDTENPVADFIAEGYYAVEADGYWTVEEVSGTADSLEELMAALELGGEIALGEDLDLPTAAVINNEVTLDLNGKTLTVSQDTVGDGVFHVIAGGKLTINGEGTVNGLGNNDYSMAVWADGGQVVINGGTFTNVGAGEDDHYDLIYAKNGGSVEICGGTFTCQTPKWTLNKHDSTGSIITVKGGTFLGYDPSHSDTENPVADFIAEGYYAVEADGYWTVTSVPEGSEE